MQVTQCMWKLSFKNLRSDCPGAVKWLKPIMEISGWSFFLMDKAGNPLCGDAQTGCCAARAVFSHVAELSSWLPRLSYTAG